MQDTVTNQILCGTHPTDYDSYIMSSSNQIVSKQDRTKKLVILQYQDNTEWVFLQDNPRERFCGFLYLQKALNEFNLNTIRAAENKIAIHDRQIIYLSRYYGEKPDSLELSKENIRELSIFREEIGFKDMYGNSNLRKKDNIVYVFDTEKASFYERVRGTIDSFVDQHNAIRSILEKSLKNSS